MKTTCTLVMMAAMIACRAPRPHALSGAGRIEPPSNYSRQLQRLATADVNHEPLAMGKGKAPLTPTSGGVAPAVGYTHPPEPELAPVQVEKGRVAAPGYLYSSMPGKAIDIRGLDSGVIILDPWSGRQVRVP